MFPLFCSCKQVDVVDRTKSAEVEGGATSSHDHRLPPVPPVNFRHENLSYAFSASNFEEHQAQSPPKHKMDMLTFKRVETLEYTPGEEYIEFLMAVPKNAEPGKVLVNIGGRNMSVLVPEGVRPGEKIILVAPKPTDMGPTSATAHQEQSPPKPVGNEKVGTAEERPVPDATTGPTNETNASPVTNAANTSPVKDMNMSAVNDANAIARYTFLIVDPKAVMRKHIQDLVQNLFALKNEGRSLLFVLVRDSVESLIELHRFKKANMVVNCVIFADHAGAMTGAEASMIARIKLGFTGLIVGIVERKTAAAAVSEFAFLTSGADVVIEKPLKFTKLRQALEAHSEKFRAAHFAAVPLTIQKNMLEMSSNGDELKWEDGEKQAGVVYSPAPASPSVMKGVSTPKKVPLNLNLNLDFLKNRAKGSTKYDPNDGGHEEVDIRIYDFFADADTDAEKITPKPKSNPKTVEEPMKPPTSIERNGVNPMLTSRPPIPRPRPITKFPHPTHGPYLSGVGSGGSDQGPGLTFGQDYELSLDEMYSIHSPPPRAPPDPQSPLAKSLQHLMDEFPS